ncbi:MAG: hypothetical protein VW378_08110 [bacterium]
MTLEINSSEIFEDASDMEAIDKKIAQTNLDHLNSLEQHLKRGALTSQELLRNVQVMADAASDKALKKVLKILINDERESYEEN